MAGYHDPQAAPGDANINQLQNLLRNLNVDSYSSRAERSHTVKLLEAALARSETPYEILWRHAAGNPSLAACIKVCVDLDLFKKWRDTARETASVSELADLSGSEEVLLARMLRRLGSAYLLDEEAPGTYHQTPFTLALCQTEFAAWPQFHAHSLQQVFATLPQFLADTDYKTEPTQSTEHGVYQVAFDRPGVTMFQYLSKHPEHQASFSNAMSSIAAQRSTWYEIFPPKNLLHGADPQGILLVDVGGGIGKDLAMFLRYYPDAANRLVLQDLPSVTSKALPEIQNKVKITAHDFFEPQPEKHARAYLMHNIIHDWPDAKAVVILTHLRASAKPGYSKVLINDMVVSSRATDGHIQVTSMDITMMALTGSQERTEDRWRELVESAGFHLDRIWRTDGSAESVIELSVPASE